MKNQLKIVLSRTVNGNRYQTLLGHLPPKHQESVSLTRDCLTKHACKEFGAEMKDFRIIPIEGKMINIYARSHNGDTITIEYPSYLLNQ